MDGVIVAASANSTRGDDARRLREQLQGLDSKVLGVVVNGGSTVSGYGYVPSVKPTFTADNRPIPSGHPADADTEIR